MTKEPPKKSPGKSTIESQRKAAVYVRSRAGRSNSSQKWLQRQLNDPYVAASKKDGYRSRAAYKLLQLNEKFKFLRANMRIVDLGAAPGGWTQVATSWLQGKGQIVALDILPMTPLPNVTCFEADFMDEESPAKLIAALEGKADLVMSDMAAPTTGHTGTDHIRTMALAEAAYDFAAQVLAPNGTFICKLFKGGAEGELQQRLKKDFATVKYAKPAASRQESSESYLVAQGFRK